MPNFWSSMLQQAYECFNGPRTVDYEFEKKAQELKLVKEQVYQIRAIITGFPQRTSGIKAVCSDIFNSFSLPFEKEKCYYGFADDVCNAHKALEKSYSSCAEMISKIGADTGLWVSSFQEVDELLKKRVEARKNYDHYDEKMEKLVKERNEKLSKGKKESAKDVEVFERNEEKFRNSATEYISLSNQAYYKMQELLDSRYKLITPIMVNFLEEEKKFFNQASQIMNYFNNLAPRVQQLHLSYQKTPIKYNAIDYLRGRHIIGKDFEKNQGNSKLIQTGIIIGGKPQITSSICPDFTPNQNQGGYPPSGGFGGTPNPMPNSQNPYNQQNHPQNRQNYPPTNMPPSQNKNPIVNQQRLPQYNFPPYNNQQHPPQNNANPYSNNIQQPPQHNQTLNVTDNHQNVDLNDPIKNPYEDDKEEIPNPYENNANNIQKNPYEEDFENKKEEGGEKEGEEGKEHHNEGGDKPQ